MNDESIKPDGEKAAEPLGMRSDADLGPGTSRRASRPDDAVVRDHDLTRAIEAILLVSDQPVEPTVLAQLLETRVDDIERLCDDLRRDFDEQGRGFVVHKVAGGWRFQTHPDLAPYVERFVLDGQVGRLSSAAMETLAIVAYKQPISRTQISAIRGVNCDGVARTLEARGYIVEVSRDPGPGQAVLYGTSDSFLERLGLASLDDLPPLGQFVPASEIVEALETTLMVGSEPDIVAVATSHARSGEAEGDHRGRHGVGDSDRDEANEDANEEAVDAGTPSARALSSVNDLGAVLDSPAEPGARSDRTDEEE